MIIKKTFFAILLLAMMLTNSFSAGTESSETSKVKSDYEKAVSIIKAAKKYEKKGKLEKAKKRYEKAQKFLLKSNEKKPNPLRPIFFKNQ